MSAAQFWLLDLEVAGGGRVYRYTSASAGGTIDGDVYDPGLDDLTVPKGTDSVDVTISDPSVDWPAMAAVLDGGTATLRRTSDGDPIEYLSGEIRAMSWGSRFDPIALRVERIAGAPSQGHQIPDALAAVLATNNPDGTTTAVTWPTGASGAVVGDVGRFYPVILGLPGYLGSADDTYACVPIPLAQWATAAADSYAIVAEDVSQGITEVLVRAETTSTESTQTVQGVTDVAGRRTLGINFTGAPLVRPYSSDDPRELFAGFYPSGGGGPRSVYDALVYLLQRWGSDGTDWSRLPSVADALGIYQIGTWIDSPVTDPWSWCDAVLGDLPFEVRTSGVGKYLVERRYLSDPGRRVGTITEGVDCTIAGSVGFSDGPFNEFVARFRPDRYGAWLASVTLSGRDGLESARTTGASVDTTAKNGRCTASSARYGPRQAESIDLGWTWDEGTALRVLEVAAARDALPARLVSYVVDDGENLEEGDEVTLYDEDRGFAGVAAIVDGPPVVGSTAVTVPFRVPA